MKYKKGTFVIVPNLDILEGKPTEMQTLFMWICSYANDEGQCFPSRSVLSRKCGVTIKTIDKYIKVLVELGILEKTLRRKEGKKENTSNLYQIATPENITTLPTETNDPTPSETITTTPSHPNDPVTISNITIPNITISTELTLPTHRGKLAHQRLDSIYIDLYYNLYLSKPSVSDIGKRLKIFKDLLSVYTELQIAILLITFFNWNGMDNNSSKDRDFFTNNAHAIHLFKYNINKFELYIKNVSGYKVEFENSNKDLLEFIGNWIINLTNKI